MNISEERLYKELGQKLREYREGRFTQSQIAQQIGLERTSITNIERGAQKVPLHVLYRICAAMKIDISAVLPTIESIKDVNVLTEQVTLGNQTFSLPPMAAQALSSVVGDGT